jgi:Protein of unknown function (DUF3306)
MTDRGDSASEKGFLSRWSQRKQEARQEHGKDPLPAGPPEPAAEKPAEPEFDLSSLPKLEDLTETSDITAFLRKGVPEHLRNAALRKSWALDPAIRNYVNPALDYAYDWNTPGGVPGSGEIGAGVDIARMVSQIMGGAESVAELAEPNLAPPLREQDAGQTVEPPLAVQPVRLGEPQSEAQETASPVGDKPLEEPAATQQSVRRHGTAKPVVRQKFSAT